MKQKKRVWRSFKLWEAKVFEQYLEEMAAQGWFLESVGGSVMKFHRAEPAKRRYAALLVPGSSSLTGADSWKAEQFRKQCSSVSSARKPAGILNAAVLSGRFFIRRMMQWSVQGT